MKKGIVVVLLLLLAGGVVFPQKKETPKPRTKMERISYGLGVKIAENMKRDGVEDVDTDFLIQGLRDVFNNEKPTLNEKSIDSLVGMLQNELEARLSVRQKAEGEINRKEGEAFLAANRKKEGVMTLPSGLQYKILKAGSGLIPQRGQKVKCHYRGSFISGKEFQNSYKPNMPIEYVIGGQEIKGWNEALQLMPVGSKWQLYIPPHLAYGENGAQPIIGQNVTIILDVELLSIEPETGQAPVPGTVQQMNQFVRHFDRYASDFCNKHRTWIYVILFFLICMETGLIVMPFVPADALLFAFGSLAAISALQMEYAIPLFLIAALAGDNVGYWFGRKKVFNTEESPLFNKEYLGRTCRFYDKHGWTSVLLARFIPVIRTFAPYRAGSEGIPYKIFMSYSVISALLWVSLLVLAGYSFGNIPLIKQNFSIVIIVAVGIQGAPSLISFVGQGIGRRKSD